MEHKFKTEKIKSGYDGTEYLLIFCEKCGIVSYDQRYESKSYKNNYKVEKCISNIEIIGKPLKPNLSNTK